MDRCSKLDKTNRDKLIEAIITYFYAERAEELGELVPVLSSHSAEIKLLLI